MVKLSGRQDPSPTEAPVMDTAAIASPSLNQLMGELTSHPVNHHPFFLRFQAQHLTRRQLQAFFRQYHYFCKHFVKVLEGLLYATPIDEIEMRVELVKTLHSELGSGSCEQAHVKQLERFGETLGLGPSDLRPACLEKSFRNTVLRSGTASRSRALDKRVNHPRSSSL